jgi:hypothetical protein
MQFFQLKKLLEKIGNPISQGDYIIREATNGDTFYIIAEGSVRVTKKAAVVAEGADQEEEIRTLARGDYFGEQVSFKTKQKYLLGFKILTHAVLCCVVLSTV